MSGGGGQGQGYTSNTGSGGIYGGQPIGNSGGNAYAQQPPQTPFMGQQPQTMQANPFHQAVASLPHDSPMDSISSMIQGGNILGDPQPMQASLFQNAVAPAQPNPQTQGGGIAGLLGNGYGGQMGGMNGQGMGGDQDVVVHGHPVGAGQMQGQMMPQMNNMQMPYAPQNMSNSILQ